VTFDLQYRPQICSPFSLVEGRISAKLEASTAFVFPENRRHATDGQTDVVQRLMRPPSWEGRIIILQVQLQLAVKGHSSKSTCCMPARNMRAKLRNGSSRICADKFFK